MPDKDPAAVICIISLVVVAAGAPNRFDRDGVAEVAGKAKLGVADGFEIAGVLNEFGTAAGWLAALVAPNKLPEAAAG